MVYDTLDINPRPWALIFQMSMEVRNGAIYLGMKSHTKFLKCLVQYQFKKKERDTNKSLACPPPLISTYRPPGIKSGQIKI